MQAEFSTEMRPTAKRSLEEILTAALNCDREELSERLLRDCLPLHAKALHWLLGRWPDYFKNDIQGIRECLSATCAETFQMEIWRLEGIHKREKSLFRRVLRLRVSCGKLCKAKKHLVRAENEVSF